MYDVIVIGAGITGTLLAKDLSRYNLKVAVLEKENDIADGATMANSAIVHTGYDPEDGTLKASMNVQGARLYPQLCKDLHCKYKTVGAYVVACGEQEEAHLSVLADRADRRGISYRWLTGDEARAEEPNLQDSITKVLDFYTTAVIYPWEVAIACAEVAIQNGVKFYLNHEVQSIEYEKDHYCIHTIEEYFDTKIVVNAAGIGAEKIYRMVSPEPNFHITPRKGEYFVLDNDVHYVNHIIFPVPGPNGKGVLAVPTVYGNTLIGPNSTYTEGTPDTGTTDDGMNIVRKNISKTMKNVPYAKVIRSFAGLRPSSTSKDFIIEEAKDAPNFINIASIESPGLASAPGISQYVIEHILSNKLNLIEDSNAIMIRKKTVVMADLTPEERDAKIKENPLYAKIICRCEQISEGEIVDCINSLAGATTIKGVKKRVRPGMGRCQGGFCEPRVLAILARELHISPLDVVLDSKKSLILEKENRS